MLVLCLSLHGNRSYSDPPSQFEDGMATSQYLLPPLSPLDIHDANAANKWKKFKRAWTSYSLATELNTKLQSIQVATLLTVIGEEACEVF